MVGVGRASPRHTVKLAMRVPVTHSCTSTYATFLRLDSRIFVGQLGARYVHTQCTAIVT
jgi:hypothetical protein